LKQVLLELNRYRHSLETRKGIEPAPRIAVGITSAQTCLVLCGRLRALKQAGFDVTLMSSPGELLDRLELKEGVRVLRIPIRRRIAPLADLVSLVALWKELRLLKPDVVEFSTPKAGLLGLLAALLASVPVRVYCLRGLKLESTSGLKRKILWLAERIAAACAHVVLCNSPSLRKQALALKIASDAKLQVLGSGSSIGVDIDRFRPGATSVRQQFGIPKDTHVLGYVGRFTRDKGIPELIDSFDLILQSAPQSYLLMVGWFDEAEDALDPALRRRIVTHPRIVCTGFVTDATPYYRAMDLLILPTQREGFPNVVLEASATGIPVLTTLSTGACDSVVHGKTGLLVPASDPHAIYRAAMRLLRDPFERRRMGAAGRAWVTENFLDWRIHKLTASFYKNLLMATRPSTAQEKAAMEWAAPLR